MPGMAMEIWIPMNMARAAEWPGRLAAGGPRCAANVADRAAERRRDAGTGERGSGGVRAATGAGIAADERRLPRQPDARLEGAFRSAIHAACAAAYSDGSVLCVVPDCGRKRSQPAACPRHGPAAGVERAHGAGCEPLAPGAAASYREPAAGGDGRAGGHPSGSLAGTRAGLDAAVDRISGGFRFQPERGPARVYRGFVLRRRSADGARPRPALGEKRLGGGAERRREERHARRRPEPDPRTAGGFRGGAGVGGAGGHRPFRAQLSKCAGHPSGLRRKQCVVCEIPPGYFLYEFRAEGAVLPAAARPDRRSSGNRHRELRECRTGGDRQRPVVGRKPGRIRSRSGRGHARVERHGRAGIFRHAAHCGAGRARFHGTRRHQ